VDVGINRLYGKGGRQVRHAASVLTVDTEARVVGGPRQPDAAETTGPSAHICLNGGFQLPLPNHGPRVPDAEGLSTAQQEQPLQYAGLSRRIIADKKIQPGARRKIRAPYAAQVVNAQTIYEHRKSLSQLARPHPRI
jgi:hypothetical protein